MMRSEMMKKILCTVALVLCILLFAAPVFAFNVPQSTNEFYVNDFAGVIDSSTEQYIMSRAVPLARETGAQIVVVAIDTLNDEPIEDVALSILRGWGIGDKQKNNGVLILLAVNDRQSRIEVGYGLEGALPDAKTGRIQDNYMIPHFKEGNFSLGIKSGFQAILNEVYKEYGIEGEMTEDIPSPAYGDNEDRMQLFGIIAIIIFLLIDWIFLRGSITRFLLIAFFNNRGGRGGRGGFGGGGSYRGGGGSGGGGGSSRKW